MDNEFNEIILENHDFEANTKVIVVDFDNIDSSRDLIRCLIKINLIKLVSKMKEDSTMSKDQFESMVIFLSSYKKAKDFNEQLSSLFTIVDERNSEESYTGPLQFEERLKDFLNHKTELVDFGPFYELFGVEKKDLESIDVTWVRHMLMLSSSRGIMQTGLSIPAKNLACWRVDDLSVVTSDYNPRTNKVESFLTALKRVMIQLFGRMAKANKEGNEIISKNAKNYVEGQVETREKVTANRVLLLFRATQSKHGERIDFFQCIELIESIPSIKVDKEILYCSFKPSKQKTPLEIDPSYNLQQNEKYTERLKTIGKREIIYEICRHLEIINEKELISPSQKILKSLTTFSTTDEDSEERKIEKYSNIIYDKEIKGEIEELIEKITSNNIPRKSVTVNWANTRAVINIGSDVDKSIMAIKRIAENIKVDDIGFELFINKYAEACNTIDEYEKSAKELENYLTADNVKWKDIITEENEIIDDAMKLIDEEVDYLKNFLEELHAKDLYDKLSRKFISVVEEIDKSSELIKLQTNKIKGLLGNKNKVKLNKKTNKINIPLSRNLCKKQLSEIQSLFGADKINILINVIKERIKSDF
jgi:hypothetical protein